MNILIMYCQRCFCLFKCLLVIIFMLAWNQISPSAVTAAYWYSAWKYISSFGEANCEMDMVDLHVYYALYFAVILGWSIVPSVVICTFAWHVKLWLMSRFDPSPCLIQWRHKSLWDCINKGLWYKNQPNQTCGTLLTPSDKGTVVESTCFKFICLFFCFVLNHKLQSPH